MFLGLLLLTAAVALMTHSACRAETEQDLDSQLRGLLQRHRVTPLDVPEKADEALVDLGRMLFFDKELGGNRDVACSTCHLPSQAGVDGLSLSIGTKGGGLGSRRTPGEGRSLVPRNATDLFNRGDEEWFTQFWDNRIMRLKDGSYRSEAGDQLPEGLENVVAVQALFPPTDRVEMRGRAGDLDINGQPNELALIDDEDFTAIWNGIMDRLMAIPEYVELFAAAYPDIAPEDCGPAELGNALAAFQAEAFTLLDSPFDRYLAGDNDALSEEQKRGAMVFFGSAECGTCHHGPLLTDQRLHNVAIPQLGPGRGPNRPLDEGGMNVTGDHGERFAFRTPPLRNVELTGPWMHNGSFTTLGQAVIHYRNTAGRMRGWKPKDLEPYIAETWLDDEELIEEIINSRDALVDHPVAIPVSDAHLLVAFLTSLTDPAARDLSHVVPESVPSGLKIDR